MVDLFIRMRSKAPSFAVLDVDATDDPTHGDQCLSLCHGYYDQYQYFPLLVFDGETGFPLAAWLRHGPAHASLGAVDVLETVVAKLRQAFLRLTILVRGDTGFAVPGLYEYCEREGLLYVFVYAANEVLKRRTESTLARAALYSAS